MCQGAFLGKIFSEQQLKKVFFLPQSYYTALEDLWYCAWVYIFYYFSFSLWTSKYLLCFTDETQHEAVNKWWQNFHFWVYCLFNYCIGLMLSLNIPPFHALWCSPVPSGASERVHTAGPWQRDQQMPGCRDSHWIKQVQPTKPPPPPPQHAKKTSPAHTCTTYSLSVFIRK